MRKDGNTRIKKAGGEVSARNICVAAMICFFRILSTWSSMVESDNMPLPDPRQMLQKKNIINNLLFT